MYAAHADVNVTGYKLALYYVTIFFAGLSYLLAAPDLYGGQEGPRIPKDPILYHDCFRL